MDVPEEVINSPSALPKDPILRKQHLEDLLAKIHGSFSFMQVEYCFLQPGLMHIEFNGKLLLHSVVYETMALVFHLVFQCWILF